MTTEDAQGSGPPSALAVPGDVAIARTLEDATRLLDFNRPLAHGDRRWVDLSPARADRVQDTMVRKLLRKPPGQHCHLAFVSHRGMGKSTELLRLQERLGARYSSLYFVANTEMDPVTITREDLLLVLAQGVELWMRGQGLPLNNAVMERIADWFAETTQIAGWMQHAELEIAAEARADASIPFLAKLLAGFKSLVRAESETRQTVTRTLRQYPGTLLRSVNQLLDDANAKLAAAGRGDILIMIDNLDRYRPTVIDELLIRGGDQIRALHCTLIVTPPISLEYRPESARLNQYFDVEVMHAPRLRRRDQPYRAFDGPGRALFEQVLRQRMDIDALLPDPEARDRLIAATGGSIRDLLRLAHEASLLPDDPPITAAHIEAVCARVRAEMRDLININGWREPLIAIARSHQLNDHDACLDLLYHRLVLKYNGDTWYDVHPLVAEIPEIRAAIEASVPDTAVPGARGPRPGPTESGRDPD